MVGYARGFRPLGDQFIDGESRGGVRRPAIRFAEMLLRVPHRGASGAPITAEGPSVRRGHVFNATVVPQGGLGYLTLWPDGEPKPLVFTLNALDGSITNNMAIVPSTNGKVDGYASGITQLILVQ